MLIITEIVSHAISANILEIVNDIQLVTQAYSEKNECSYQRRTLDFPITCSDALLLSYNRIQAQITEVIRLEILENVI